MRGSKVRHLGLEVLPVKVVEDGEIRDRNALKETIQRLIKKLKITVMGGSAGISLSGSAVIIKHITLAKPHTDPDFYEYLYHEAEQYLQYDVSELYIDCEVLPSARGSSGTPLLLVGAKRDVVEAYTTLIGSIGLKTSVVDCDVLASINIVSRTTNIQMDLVVIVNVGYASTQVSLLIDGNFVYTREVPIGGNNYSAKMVELIGLDLESAETVKITMGNGEHAVSEECENIVSEVNSSLVHEVNATIEYYFQSGEANVQPMKPAKVFLMGGGSKTIGLDAAMREVLQTQVEHINPFQKVGVNSSKFDPQFIAQQGHLFGVAMGIALRKLDSKKDKKSA